MVSKSLTRSHLWGEGVRWGESWACEAWKKTHTLWGPSSWIWKKGTKQIIPKNAWDLMVMNPYNPLKTNHLQRIQCNWESESSFKSHTPKVSKSMVSQVLKDQTKPKTWEWHFLGFHRLFTTNKPTPWKFTIPKGKDRLPTIIFQGRAVKLGGWVFHVATWFQIEGNEPIPSMIKWESTSAEGDPVSTTGRSDPWTLRGNRFP